MILPYYPVIPLLGIYMFRETQNTNLKEECTPVFIEALFTIAKLWNQPKGPPADERIETLVHLHNGILLSHRLDNLRATSRYYSVLYPGTSHSIVTVPAHCSIQYLMYE